jgi:hypothetical protein
MQAGVSEARAGKGVRLGLGAPFIEQGRKKEGQRQGRRRNSGGHDGRNGREGGSRLRCEWVDEGVRVLGLIIEP